MLIVTRQPSSKNLFARAKPNPRVIPVITTLGFVAAAALFFSGDLSTTNIPVAPDLSVESTQDYGSTQQQAHTVSTKKIKIFSEKTLLCLVPCITL
jgi:hypothetical protein